jgi:hypothetical protein
LLIHGTQPAGSAASEALKVIKKKARAWHYYFYVCPRLLYHTLFTKKTASVESFSLTAGGTGPARCQA